jgi:hypothetical protein
MTGSLRGAMKCRPRRMGTLTCGAGSITRPWLWIRQSGQMVGGKSTATWCLAIRSSRLMDELFMFWLIQALCLAQTVLGWAMLLRRGDHFWPHQRKIKTRIGDWREGRRVVSYENRKAQHALW